MPGQIALIDFGAGNLQSVRNALKLAGAGDVAVTADPEVVARADRIVLPGVGAFAACRAALFGIEGMVEALNARVRGDGVPFLGICVGMQMMAGIGLEHGRQHGLGWIGGTVNQMDATVREVRVPHMGWNAVLLDRAHQVLEEGEAYFLHGYAFDPANQADILAVTDHGGPVVAAVGRGNILGVQFHPEKSQGYGIALLERFLTWAP
ncbi:imidazole glycerol phosphate synthase subunit HisH [Novosphingopyxis sp.]|uniref:imidazole glycerol phosphate synthase subunit HisH n=1 Tax=Novosphingopyxis sp. TaxID=2709690 RepID=UPI003B5CB239